MSDKSNRKVNNYCIISKYFFAHSKLFLLAVLKRCRRKEVAEKSPTWFLSARWMSEQGHESKKSNLAFTASKTKDAKHLRYKWNNFLLSDIKWKQLLQQFRAKKRSEQKLKKFVDVNQQINETYVFSR
jgi:hypothetical protein